MIYATPEVVIAVMGITGAGKSTFIKLVTGRDDVVVGNRLSSGKLKRLLILCEEKEISPPKR